MCAITSDCSPGRVLAEGDTGAAVLAAVEQIIVPMLGQLWAGSRNVAGPVPHVPLPGAPSAPPIDATRDTGRPVLPQEPAAADMPPLTQQAEIDARRAALRAMPLRTRFPKWDKMEEAARVAVEDGDLPDCGPACADQLHWDCYVDFGSDFILHRDERRKPPWPRSMDASDDG
jgi:hypothetical protein